MNFENITNEGDTNNDYEIVVCDPFFIFDDDENKELVSICFKQQVVFNDLNFNNIIRFINLN